MIKQLVLELSPRPDPTFADFVPGRNGEALAALERLANSGEDRFVFLWGSAGSGRSHLLRAVVAAASARGRKAIYLAAPVRSAALAALGGDAVVAVDNAERLDAEAQHASFALYNRLRADQGAWVASGPSIPNALGVRADLATRLAWGLVFELHALSDDEKVAAMRSRARAHGFELPGDVVSYLLRHAPRDLPSLLDLVEAIDRLSLSQQRAITVPIAREALRAMSTQTEAP